MCWGLWLVASQHQTLEPTPEGHSAATAVVGRTNASAGKDTCLLILLRVCAPACRGRLQAFAGIVTVSVGHCHPEVVAAVNKQNELLQHTTTIYLNNQIAEYAKELADKMPGNLKVSRPVHVCPSSSTAGAALC